MISALAFPSALGGRRRRGFTLGVGLGLMVPIVLLLVLSLLPRGGSDVAGDVSPEIRAQRSALAAFESGLEPVIDDGAATVVYGMRPGINDIYDQRFDDATLASMAEGWVAATVDLRERFAAVEVPGFLSEVADLYAQSFAAYAETAEALLAAAQAAGDARIEHITRAAEHGTRADNLYDAAQSGLEEHRQRLGQTGE